MHVAQVTLTLLRKISMRVVALMLRQCLLEKGQGKERHDKKRKRGPMPELVKLWTSQVGCKLLLMQNHHFMR